MNTAAPSNQDIDLVGAMDDAQAVIEAATRAAEPTKIGDHHYAVVTPIGGDLKLVDVTDVEQKYEPRPRRKTGSFQVHDADSFVAYYQKHGLDEESEVWADLQAARIVGVLNGHPGDAAGWGDHRVTYAVKHTPAWAAWIQHDGKLMAQSAFAELIEDRLVDIVKPSGADMLELAQSFQATIGVSFESSKALSSGERQLTYKERVEASAGKTGHLEIPKEFELGLRPFEGADAFKVIARFRYRITDGNLQIGYKLARPEDVLREAFESVVDQVRSGVSCPVFLGVTA